jgi:hypothetical protein
MNHRERSPRILEISWGRMSVDGLGLGKDFRLWPGGGREWDWSETGTSHVPGIQPAAVEELVDRGAAVMVLSQGMEKRLQIDPATYEYLERQSVLVRTAETNEAVRIYNELAEAGTPVGGLFHSTC